MKIAVGLSGGVDSTIACYLLKKAGHELVGLTMKLWDKEVKINNLKSACFSTEKEKNIEDIKEVTELLNIPYYLIDISKEFNEKILNYFKMEYINGRTPNPCIHCNQKIKFKLLLEKAKELNINFDYFATGHYANVFYDNNKKRFLLKKGVDEKKDQSYFLSLLDQNQLSKVVFPLGQYKKENIKEIAKKLNLNVHKKKESQDFYSGNYEDIINSSFGKGDIIDSSGKKLGKHKGICFYTIGQRKGIGISYKEPLYVIEIDRQKNTIIVGTEKEVFKKGLIASNINWISIENLNSSLFVKAKIRYLHKEEEAIISPYEEGKIKVEFNKPQKAITPGQYVVFYDNDIVIGGGLIDSTY